jgi:membrane-associated phospholipid phosphatase/tRNA A-37 threonylcarbamoyl transferase component Bud32
VTRPAPRRPVGRRRARPPSPPDGRGAAGGGSGWALPRHPGDAVRVVLAGGTLVITAVFVHRERVAITEADLFRLLNDLPDAWIGLLWPVMQMGNILAVPVAAAGALAYRRFRLAAEICIAGGGVWLLAKVIKTVIVRPRPAVLLAGVHVRGAPAGGSGYLSGHAAVAVALATLLSPYVGRRSRRVLWALAGVVCVSRLYVGAHLPLDVLGGAALGWGVGALTHLLLGAPTGRPSVRGLRRALAERGYAIADLTAVDLDARRSAPFVADTVDGRRLFLKVVPRERRDVDVLYRMWLALTGGRKPSGRPPRGGGTPVEQVGREAAMGQLAKAAGVRVPEVLSVGGYGNGTGLLVHPWVDARSIAVAGCGETGNGVGDGGNLARDAWRQVSRLRAVGLAHRALSPENVLVDAQRRVWLVDFDEAVAPADATDLDADLDAMRDTLAAAVGAEVTAAAARSVFGGDVGFLAQMS